MTHLRRILTTAFVLLTFAPSFVHACSCVSVVGNGCGQWLPVAEGAVFLGKVTAKVDLTEPKEPDMPGRSGYAVHFAVTETFHVGSDLGAETVVYTASGFGDCGYPFVVGASYLVYASRDKGQLGTSTCSGTSPETRVGGVLKQLRAIRDTGRGFDVFGTAVKLGPGAGFSGDVNTEPLQNMTVRVIGSLGNLFFTDTDDHGAYTFAWLSPDTYRIEQDLPPGLSIAGRPPEPLRIEASDKKAAGLGCQLDLFASPDGRISGIVVDSAGKGVPGFVTLEPTDPKEAAASFQRGGLPGDTTADGKFALPQLPPGRYRLIFSPKIGSRVNLQQKCYWPPSNAANPGAIEIGLGQHVDDVRFEVPLSGSAQ